MTRRLLLVAALAAGSSQAWAASVLGRAVGKNGSSLPGPCHAIVQPELYRRGAPEPDPASPTARKANLSVPLTQTGYFQMVGVPPGKYVLAVECPTASAVRELEVEPKRTNRVDPPLVLEDLTLKVVVTPAVDPDGQPWQLNVDATMPRLRRIASRATTSAEGQWERRGLVAGNYRVNISSSNGMPWLQRFFNLSEKSGPLLLRLPFMRVEGAVRLNSQPVRARLTFHNDAGGEPMTLTSDDAGFFHGLLPVTPDVRETKWTVEARGIQPTISRRLSGVSVQSVGAMSAWLDLELPIFAVHGTVRSSKGQLQSGVQVTFEDVSSGTQTSTATDDSGGFELADLPPGKYIARAESLDGISERTPFQVNQGVENELKLTLKPSEVIPFHVVSRDGPVSDASVQIWIPPGMPRYLTHTDSEGRFDVKLPPGTQEVGLTVAAPGYAVKLTRLRVSSENDESSDGNTITLGESGGTLMLDLQPLGRAPDNSSTPYLVHNQAIEALGTLADWNVEKPYAAGHGPMMIKTIDPGVYALCLLRDPAQLSVLWLGTPPSDLCRTGSLEQNGTLTLSPP